MPTKTKVPLFLERPTSSSPPLSPASSLSSEHSLVVVAASSVKKPVQIHTKKRYEVVKPTHQRASFQRVFDRSGSDTSIASQCSNRSGGLQGGGCLLKVRSDKQDPGEALTTEKLHAGDTSAWPVLVAVRCRPRKRQRAEKRFSAAPRADDQLRCSRFQDSSYSSNDSSSDESGSNHRPSSSSVQRGVFEYSAFRDYDYAATHEDKLPPPRVRRPHRLYVQAPTHGNGGGGTSGRRSFDFDFIFPPWKKQRDVYDKCVQTQIRHVLQSHRQDLQQHATIVAYGQTGTGKTYTMGMLSDFTDDSQRGIIPRALSQILEFASNTNTEDLTETVVTLSFLQIYLETIQDLLSLPVSVSNDTSRNSGKHHDTRRGNNDLPVRQERDGAFYVTGLNEYEISSIEDAHALLELAMHNRVLAATTKNKTSSRSHTLLTISIKKRRQGTTRRGYSCTKDEDEERSSVDEEDEFSQASTISFVDLAGSERVDGALHFLRATRARQEQRIREAKFINRSLSALGGVIAALAQPKTTATAAVPAHVLGRLNSSVQGKMQHPVGNEQGQPHIRFRDSQLTKLLQGRLMGGRGRLLLIATVDDQPQNLSETLSTLKFAAQCRRVELQPGSRLRGDRTARLRRQDSLLDQVFNDMKMMHENREAVLHGEYQARIDVLERELEAARAAQRLSLSSMPQEVAPMHFASYMALCSLVDAVCAIGDEQDRKSKHPSIIDFQGEKDMLEYVAMLYSRLKESLVSQQKPTAKQSPDSRLQPVRKDQHEGEHQIRQPVPAAEDQSTPVAAQAPIESSRTSTRRARSRIQLSPEQEAEFRSVARHLITSRALDSIAVSSSEDEEEIIRQ